MECPFSDLPVSARLLSFFQFGMFLQFIRGLMGGFTHSFLWYSGSYHQAPFSSWCSSTTGEFFQTKLSQDAHYSPLPKQTSTFSRSSIENETTGIAQRATDLQAQPRPNQSLKLTEIAVDDSTRANQIVTIGHRVSRADWTPSLRRFAAAA